MKTILITGGTGLIGRHLTKLLLENGYEVAVLGRKKSKDSGIKKFTWNPEKGEIDTAAIASADYIIHLAGSGIADKRWTKLRKQELYESRVATTSLLFHTVQNTAHKLKAFIATSAIGYYGNRGNEWLNEESSPGKDFLAQLCVDWEKQSLKFQQAGIRTIINRFGIVLSQKGGALEKMAQPVDFGIAPYLGNGRQFLSWIHIDDLCRIILHEIRNPEMQGIYNLVAPNPARNKEMMQAIVKAKGKPALLVPTPEIALRLGLGEMADTVLGSQRCAAEKILKAGFQFEFTEIDAALKSIFK